MVSQNRSRIRLAHGDSIETINIIAGNYPSNGDPDKFYFFYLHNQVKKTMGTYTGKLLDGEYLLYNRKMDLLEKGYFDKGIKKGEWRQWYSNGNLKLVEYWKNSLRQRGFMEYHANGNIKRQGHYNDNRLQGKVITYDDKGKRTITNYKEGNIKQEKTKASVAGKVGMKWSKIKSIRIKKRKDRPKKEAAPAANRSSSPQKKKLHIPFFRKSNRQSTSQDEGAGINGRK